MGVLKQLKPLKKLKPLAEIGETPISKRFHKKLIREWTSLIAALARSFAIPRRLDASDIEAELLVVLWRLTKRVDPVTRPDEFRRMAKAEMRNKCVDLVRFHNAQKRMARTGKGMDCLICGTTSLWLKGTEPSCPVCGTRGVVGKKTSLVKWSDLRVHDVSIARSSNADDLGGSDEEAGHGSVIETAFSDPRQASPDSSMMAAEIIDYVRRVLPAHPEGALLDLYIDPPSEFVDFLLGHGYRADPRRAPYWLLSEWLKETQKVLRRAHTRICLAMAEVARRPDMLRRLSPHNLRQIGYVF